MAGSIADTGICLIRKAYRAERDACICKDLSPYLFLYPEGGFVNPNLAGGLKLDRIYPDLRLKSDRYETGGVMR